MAVVRERKRLKWQSSTDAVILLSDDDNDQLLTDHTTTFLIAYQNLLKTVANGQRALC